MTMAKSQPMKQAHTTMTLMWLPALGSLMIAAAVSAVLLGQRAFQRLVHRDVQTMFAQTSASRKGIVTEELLASLPAPVQRYLTYTGIVGKPFVRAVRLKQHGAIRLGADQPWIALDAREYYSVQPPGFVWDGTMHLGPVPLARARDIYQYGHGNMLVKAGALLSVVDANGDEIDQGAMMRYLSEMIFFPTAFLGDNVSFEAVDDRSAHVTLTDHGRSVSGTMYFDQEGKLTNFVARRYRMVGGRYDLQTWSNPVMAYGEFEGLRLPVRGKAAWKLAEGDFDYIDVAITDLEYQSELAVGDRVPALA